MDNRPAPNQADPEEEEQDEPHDDNRTEFMLGEFFQIPRDMQLPDVVGQIKEIEKSKSLAWASGGEPDPGKSDE